MIHYEILSLERVTLSVNGQKVLNDISFRLFEDEVTFLVGNPHGGKTMLTRILSGEIDSYQGRIILDGKPYKPTSAKRRRGSKIYTITDYCPLMEEMTIAENIGLARPPFALALNYKKKLSEFVSSLCNENGIDLDMSMTAKNLRPLDRLKIHFARALVSRARVVVINNVLYMLSDTEIQILMTQVRNLMRHGIGVIFLEPIARHAVTYADKIFVIANGCLRMSFRHNEADASTIERIIVTSDTIPQIKQQIRHPENHGRLIQLELPYKDRYSTATLYSGRIYAVSSRDPETYYWILNNIISKGWAQFYRSNGGSGSIHCVTYQDLLNGSFDSLSVAENIALPTAGYISSHGILNMERYHQFIKSEFSEVLEPGMFDWKTRMYSMRTWYRMQAVLFRALLNNSDVLLLCGLLDQPNAGLRRLVETAATMAAERDKAVLIFGRRLDDLNEWCDEQILI